MWKCENCIHKNKLNNKAELCIGLCKDVYAKLNKENHCYQEIIEKPINCGCCQYLKNNNYCSVKNWDSDDNEIFFKIVRKNYLIKNTPKWCPLKENNA